MDYAEHPSFTSQRQPVDVVLALAEHLGANQVQTNGRFSLARAETADAILLMPDSSYHRVLIARENDEQVKRYDLLHHAHIPLPTRRILDDGMIIYDLSLNAKLLSNERLFADRESSETYVSDRELFIKAGQMWSRIWQVSGEIPHELLRNTLMVEFSSHESPLMPAPPFADWELIHNEEIAEDHIRQILTGELDQYASDKANFRSLVNAFIAGWHGERSIQ
ncbi:MAG: hypothetical protein NVS1B7_1950 [Candidatus Saccharimonadales bacterium]